VSEGLPRTLAHSLTTLATTHPGKNLKYIAYLGVLYQVWSQKQETNMKDMMDRGNKESYTCNHLWLHTHSHG